MIHRGRRVLVLLAIVLAMPLTSIGWATWTMQAHGVPMSRFARLREGMSTAQVQQLLGRPKSAYTDAAGTQRWMYDRNTWCYMVVLFSADGKVSEFEHDH